MTDILFYHLTESKLEDALPPLLDKSVERGWRVVVQTADEARRDALDTHLWTYRADSFLPHGTDAADFAADQPILLTAVAAMIGAVVLLADPIFQGLAISLLFGLASSTLLTVLVIPAIYRVLRT